jgi:hypothetical protein
MTDKIRKPFHNIIKPQIRTGFCSSYYVPAEVHKTGARKIKLLKNYNNCED